MAKIPNNRKNEDYWKAREQAERAWISQNLANDEQFNRHLAKYYQQAIDNINSELEHELLNMKKGHFLNQEVVEATDVQHFQDKAKKIVEQANQMRKAGKQVTYADFSKAVNDQMRVYNATMRINRLEMLKSQIGLEMVQSGIDVDKALHDKLSQDYIDEVKRQAGIMGVTAKPSMWTDSKVAKVIMGQTESANFSQRLWANQAALKAQLDQVISTGIIQGQNPREMATKLKANVAKTIANYRYVTERLARTESARVQHRAQIDSLIANDYRFCKWHAEPGRCKVCGEIASNDPDGNGRGIYEVDDVPIVPVHPNCRCSISAYWVNGQDNSYRGKHKKSVKQLTDSINSYKDFEKSLKNNFKIEKVVGMDRVPLEHLQKIYGSFSRNFNRFPALKGKMKNIVGYSKASDRALGEYVPKERTMRINVAQINGFSETLNRCVKNNWWTPKKDFTGVIDHEFGHFVQDSYPELNGGGFDDWEDREKEKSWGKRLIYKAIENSGEELSRNTVIQHCSKYGATNDYEMFAEYFSNSSDDKVINEFNKLLNSERCFKEDKK